MAYLKKRETEFGKFFEKIRAALLNTLLYSLIMLIIQTFTYHSV